MAIAPRLKYPPPTHILTLPVLSWTITGKGPPGEKGLWSGWSPKMGAGGHGGHSLAEGTFFSTDLVYTVGWPGHTWNLRWCTEKRSRDFPKIANSGHQPRRTGGPVCPPPQGGSCLLLRGRGGLSSFTLVNYAPTPKGAQGGWGQSSPVF